MPTVLLILVMLLGQPRLVGLASHYDQCFSPACVFRNGEPWSPDAQIVAVDDSEYRELAGKQLLIVTENGRVAVLKVADSGYLYRAGYFERGPWAWRSASAGVQFVIDIPRDRFLAAFETLDTQLVSVFVLD